MDSCSIASGRDGWRGGICCTSLRSFFHLLVQVIVLLLHSLQCRHILVVFDFGFDSLFEHFSSLFPAFFFRSAANARRPELTSPLPVPAPARMILMSNSAVRCSPRRNETKPRGDALRRANANKAFPIQAHRTLFNNYMPSSWGYQPSGGPPADSACLRPEAPLGPRLITFKRRFGPPESCPLAPPTASAAPR